MQKVKSQNSEGGDKGAILTLGEGDGHGIFQFLYLRNFLLRLILIEYSSLIFV
jgi:hypothetical protein